MYVGVRRVPQGRLPLFKTPPTAGKAFKRKHHPYRYTSGVKNLKAFKRKHPPYRYTSGGAQIPKSTLYIALW